MLQMIFISLLWSNLRQKFLSAEIGRKTVEQYADIIRSLKKGLLFTRQAHIKVGSNSTI